MCGIAGVFSFKASLRAAPERLAAALAAQAHRGPDARDVWVSPCGRWGLAHALLGFTDLTRGAHPLWSADGRYAVVCNGELYDYETTFAAKAPHYVRRTRSDSELILAMYERYGLDMLPHLHGEFAFALLDTVAGELLLVRDRFGVKPLHYARRDDRLVFASELKGIRAYDGPLVLDPRMAEASALLSTPPDRTVFAGIRQVPAGHVVRVTMDGLAVQRWFVPDFPAADALAAVDSADAASAVRGLVSAAVRRRLPGGGIAAAAYLSGGIDSSIVFAEMARASADPVSAFTIRFAGEAADEAVEAAPLVSTFGGRHHVVTLNDEQLVEAFEACLWHTEAPISNHHATAKLLLNRTVSAAGFRCALSGEGADELLLGYPSFLDDYFEAASAEARAGWLARRAGLTNRSLGVAAGKEPLPAWLGELPQPAPNFLRAVLQLTAADQRLLRNPARALGEIRQMLVAAVAGAGPAFAACESVTRAQQLWKQLVFPSYHLICLGDRVEMASSVEARLPFLDSALYAYVCTLPAALKVGDGIGKAVLRTAFAEIIGGTAARRPKRAFLAPGTQAMHRMRERQLEILADGEPILDALFDRNALRLQLGASDRLVTRVVSLYALAKLFG